MQHVQIDFVSDVTCPWCAIGLASLERALHNVESEITAQLHFEPFLLNPDLPPEGQDITEYFEQKYGISAEQARSNYEDIRTRGAALNLDFRVQGRERTWPTLAAHRMLYWAGAVDADASIRKMDSGKQILLKKALLKAYFSEGFNPANPDVLLSCAAQVGLDAGLAREVLTHKQYSTEVQARLRYWEQLGIYSVPSIVLNQQYLISGGQTPEYFEQALRQAAQSSSKISPGH